MQDANKSSGQPGWLQVVVIGRRPKTTLLRVVVLAILCGITFKFVLLPIRVEGISMEPTYHNHQVNCINRLAYLLHEPRRGDIVGIRFSEPEHHFAPSEMLMKRIIGLPGETVAFHDGNAYINGKLLAEPYVKYACDWEQPPVLCGPDQYYVVGDNREMRLDLHEHGRADRARIIGKLLL